VSPFHGLPTAAFIVHDSMVKKTWAATFQRFRRIKIKRKKQEFGMNSSSSKKLYRSLIDRKIAGVCGGLGQYFGIDPTLVRLLFVLGLIFVGGTLLAYVILAIVIPEEPV
jgi:phage shock protein C